MSKAFGANPTIDEIDRSHRVGELQSGDNPKPRDVVVKFISYWSCLKLFTKRANAKNCSFPGNYINEDLTRKRSQLLFEARSLKRNGLVMDAWASDGNVFVKDNSKKIHAILAVYELDQFREPRSYASAVQISGLGTFVVNCMLLDISAVVMTYAYIRFFVNAYSIVCLMSPCPPLICFLNMSIY